jgi:hypothetical protein
VSDRRAVVPVVENSLAPKTASSLRPSVRLMMADPNQHPPTSDWLVQTAITDPADAPHDVRKMAEGLLRLVPTAITDPADAPPDGRKMAERLLARQDLTLEGVAFIAQVRDARKAESPGCPEWLVAPDGPTPQPGIVVQTAGRWAACSSRFGIGGTSLIVRTAQRVELSEPNPTLSS